MTTSNNNNNQGTINVHNEISKKYKEANPNYWKTRDIYNEVLLIKNHIYQEFRTIRNSPVDQIIKKIDEANKNIQKDILITLDKLQKLIKTLEKTGPIWEEIK